MKKILFMVVLGLCFGLTNAQANSDEPYGYAGLGLGQGKSDFFDDDDKAIKLFGGYSFDTNFAAEIEYGDLGKYTSTSTGVTGDYATLGFSGILKGKVLKNVELFGKLGLHAWDVDFTNSFASTSADGTDIFGGVGANINLNNFAIRFEYERFTIDSGDEDVDLFSGNLIYKF